MIKAIFSAVLTCSLAIPALATPADDSFNKAIDDINAAVAKIADAKAKRTREAKASEKKTGKA